MVWLRGFRLFDNSSSAVRANLGKATQVGGVETQRDDGVTAAALGLGDDTSDGVVAGVVELIVLVISKEKKEASGVRCLFLGEKKTGGGSIGLAT